MFKRISSLMMVMVLSLMVILPVSAQENLSINTQQTITIPILSSADGTIKTPIKPDSENRLQSGNVIELTAIRDGNTENCEVYLYWAGTGQYSGWKFTSLKVDNGSSLYPKVYLDLGAKVHYCPAATTGSLKIAYVKIPKDQTQAKITIKGLMGYNNLTSSWISAYVIPMIGDIN